jgi:hypothetical protein
MAKEIQSITARKWYQKVAVEPQKQSTYLRNSRTCMHVCLARDPMHQSKPSACLAHYYVHPPNPNPDPNPGPTSKQLPNKNGSSVHLTRTKLEKSGGRFRREEQRERKVQSGYRVLLQKASGKQSQCWGLWHHPRTPFLGIMSTKTCSIKRSLSCCLPSQRCL